MSLETKETGILQRCSMRVFDHATITLYQNLDRENVDVAVYFFCTVSIVYTQCIFLDYNSFECRRCLDMWLKKTWFLFASSVIIGITSCGKLMEGYEPQLMRISEGLGGVEFRAFEGFVKKLNPQHDMPIGRNVEIFNDGVMNVGKETTGIKVILSGSAIDKRLMGNFRVKLLSFLYQPGKDLETLGSANVPFFDEKVKWVANCPTLLLKAQPGVNPLAEDNPHTGITLQLYGDTLQSGIGDLVIEVAPVDATKNEPVKIVQTFNVTNERLSYENLSTMPVEFPFSRYPNSEMTLAQREFSQPVMRVSFQTTDSADKVLAFYKNDFTTRGFTTEGDLGAPSGADDDGETILVANNGVQQVTMDIDRHSWGETEISFSTRPFAKAAALPPNQEAEAEENDTDEDEAGDSE